MTGDSEIENENVIILNQGMAESNAKEQINREKNVMPGYAVPVSI